METEEPHTPLYKPNALAAHVFDHIYFYHDETFRSVGVELMKKEVGILSVHQIYAKFTVGCKEGVKFGLAILAGKIGAKPERVIKFFAPAMLTVEERLASQKIIDFSRGPELTIFRERIVDKLPIIMDVYSKTMGQNNSKGEATRSSPLAIVLGPGGSGKTFFSLQLLDRNFLTDEQTLKVAIYCRASEIFPVAFTTEEGTNRKMASNDIAEWIKQRIAIKEGMEIPEINYPLKMHLCVIIDEAGYPKTKSWFEDGQMLSELCTQTQELATSVAVVISGTGLTGHSLSSSDDAFVFRMKPWDAADLTMLLEKKKLRLRLPLAKEETAADVATAIFANPRLRALATNARMAFFLVQDIIRLGPTRMLQSWESELYEWTPALALTVISDYIRSTPINRLTPIARRRVAASIFRALLESKRNGCQLPTFLGIEGLEITTAESLIQYNVESVGGKSHSLVPGETYAITITPPIAAVLYAMAGLGTAWMTNWRAEEELGALYAVRQCILQCMDKFAAGDVTKTELEMLLEKFRLLALPEPVQTKSDEILVPLVGSSTVLSYGKKSNFVVDIIAPYTLIQVKQQSISNSLDVDIREELEKCSLLKSSTGRSDTRILQGLLAMWQGTFEGNTSISQGQEYEPRTSNNSLYKPSF